MTTVGVKGLVSVLVVSVSVRMVCLDAGKTARSRVNPARSQVTIKSRKPRKNTEARDKVSNLLSVVFSVIHVDTEVS